MTDKTNENLPLLTEEQISNLEREEIEETVKNRSPRVVIAIGAFILTLCVLLIWFFNPTAKEKTAIVETPPSLEKSEGKTDEHSQEGSIEVNDETAEMIGLKTEPAKPGEIEDTITTTGRVLVSPNGQAIIGAKVSGRAVRVFVEPGNQVNSGQTVVIIDSPQVAELRGQLLEARSRLKLAELKNTRVQKTENQAAVIQSKNSLDLANATYQRKKKLVELGAAAKRELEEAETHYKNAKAEYDYQSSIQITKEKQEAESDVEQTKAGVERLKQSLAALGASPDETGGIITVTSPISGTVTDRHISAGETVAVDKELLTVMNLSRVIVEAELPESQAARVKVGQRLISRIPSMPDTAFEGYIDSIADTVDPQKRTIAVRARVNNSGTQLKHEMAVEVRLVTGTRKDALLIPVSALVDDEGLKVVYVKEGEKYERRPVTLGAVTYQWAEILSGLKADEEVVTAGAYQLGNMKKGGAEEGGDHDEH